MRTPPCMTAFLTGVFEVDEDSLVWGDEGVYYMME